MARKKKSYTRLYCKSTSVRGRLPWGWASSIKECCPIVNHKLKENTSTTGVGQEPSGATLKAAPHDGAESRAREPDSLSDLKRGLRPRAPAGDTPDPVTEYLALSLRLKISMLLIAATGVALKSPAYGTDKERVINTHCD
jgi:hypothetical protein